MLRRRPPVLAYDAAGTSCVIGAARDSTTGRLEPRHVRDHGGNVWIGGNGPGDSHILKFTKDGKFLMQIGKPNARRVPTTRRAVPRSWAVVTTRRTSGGWRRSSSIRKRTRRMRGRLSQQARRRPRRNHRQDERFWGAYGNKPDDAEMGRHNPDAPPLKQFRNPSTAPTCRTTGWYVCDRLNDRIQVFRPDGTFVKEAFYAKRTLSSGSAWDVAFSKDPQQRYLYLADGINNRIYVIQRDTLEVLTSFGDGGRQPGQFYGVHSIAVDSKGNIYTTETWEGKRLQKFVFKGVGRGA